MHQLSPAIIVLLMLLFSCSGKEDNTDAKQTILPVPGSIPPLQVTLLADLPDSLQPKTITLTQAPPPLRVAVPTKKGGTYTHSLTGEKIKLAPPVKKILPTLKNQAGQTVLDETGQPFVLGDGGISNFTNYTHDDGLGFGQVNRSYLDQSGNLWFGTRNGGVSRFDPSASLPGSQTGSGQVPLTLLGASGNKFTVYTKEHGLAGNTVWSIHQDRTGHFWFGTLYSGLSRYDGHSFTTYTTAQGLAGNDVRDILEDQRGNLWFSSDSGVSRYDPDRGSFTTYTIAQGLASNYVRDILEDRKGHLWFSSQERGVSRYDPRNNQEGIFKIYTTSQGLASNDVRVIFEDQRGHLWFGTINGVSRYEPDQGLFTTYTTAHDLASNNIRNIFEDQRGHLWFITYAHGVSRYVPSASSGQAPSASLPGSQTVSEQVSFTTYTRAQGLASNEVRSIHEDQSGHVWFGTDNAVSRYDPDLNFLTRLNQAGFTSYTMAQGLAGRAVWSIIEDQTGHLWFGFPDGGVSRYDDPSFTSYTQAQGLPANLVASITEDKAGHLWFGSWNGGVSHFDRHQGSLPTRPDGIPIFIGGQAGFTNYTSSQGLAGYSVISIVEDQAGHLWFGTWGDGVSRFDPSAGSGQVPSAGLPGGQTGSRQASFTTYTTEQGLAGNVVWSSAIDQAGHLWFGTQDGVSRFDPSTSSGQVPSTSLPGSQTGSGQASFTTYTTEQGLANNMVKTITVDRAGHLWFGTGGGGVSLYDLTRASFTTFTTAQGLANNVVNAIIEDQAGHFWFGTDEGLSFLSNEQIRNLPAYGNASATKSENPVLFKSFTTADGLAHNRVTQVLQLPNGKIAVGTNKGITLFDPPEDLPENFRTLSGIEIYHSHTGYPVKDVNWIQHAMYLDSQGMIWVGTGSQQTGLVRFDYQALHRNSTAPRIAIRQVKIDQEAISWHNLKGGERHGETQNIATDGLHTPAYLTEEMITLGRRLSEENRQAMQQKYTGVKFDSLSPFYYVPQGLVLPYQHNRITIHYGTNELARPNLIEYQYQLEGYDKDWSPVLKTTSATFGNMREGNYTFKVKARYTGPSLKGADEWTEPFSYPFRVLPPWYRSWLAYSIYFLVTVASIWGFIYWRTASLRNRQKVLEQTVRERTAEVVAQKDELALKNEVITKEKTRSDELLLNILPAETAEELKQYGAAKAKNYDMVTVLFTDFKEFTLHSERLNPAELVAEIDHCFKAFDLIMEQHQVEKIKTVGDAYLAAAGLPTPNTSNPVDAVKAAIAIRDFMLQYKAERETKGKKAFEIRIGVHTGPVVAGIVGIKKFAYDIWGDTVNLASRMESSGEGGKVNISQSTYEHLKERTEFTFIPRGKIKAKHKGEIDMYFAERADIHRQ